jgi:hypothetical protein
MTNIDNDTQYHTMKHPNLKPLYFDYDVTAHTSRKLEIKDHSNSQELNLLHLPSEIITNVTSFLDWGDYARLAPVHSSFQSIIHGATECGGQDAKWILAESLLNGENGLATYPKLAMKYLHDLAGVELNRDSDAYVNSVEDCGVSPANMIEDEEQIILDSSFSYGFDDNMNEHLIFTPAMRKLASCYLSGNGTSIDTTLGLLWLRTAFQYGDIDAAYEIATIYEYAKYNVTVDIFLAAKWFLLAAEKGHVEAMAEYAMCCELGCGVPQDDQIALDWYTKAAHLGHVTSNYSVAEMFEEARGGLPQSDTEAVLWYYKAAMMGDVDSKKALIRLNDIARIVLPGWASTLHD